MVRPEISKYVKKRKSRKLLRHQAAQLAINAVLWKIIRGNAEAAMVNNTDIDDIKEKDAILTVPRSEMDDIPATFALDLTHTDEELTITATIRKAKSKIIQPELYTG